MFLRVRYIFRFVFAFLKRFKGLMFLGIFIGIFIFLAVRILVPFLNNGPKLSIGIVGIYRPGNLPDSINYLITSGLTKVTDSGELEPGMASSWETADQGKTWIFHLNENLKWQDNKNIKSDDINYNFRDVVIEKPDQKTLVFKLKDKFSPFPYVVSKPAFKRGLMGMGEWKVKTIRMFKDYIETLILENKNGRLITYKFYPTEEFSKNALKLGKINKIEDIYNPSPFDSWKTIKVVSKPNFNQVITLFLNNKSDTLSEKSFRQGLSYAIDKDSSTLIRAISPISSLSWAYNPQIKNYNYDLKKAKELTSQIIKSKGGEIDLNFFTTPTLLSIAEKIAKDWNKLNVNSNITVASEIPSDFDVFLAVLDIPKDPDQYSLWHSTQTSTNISKYFSPRIDKLLEDGRAELNVEDRKKTYLDFQRFLAEDCPAIFLYYPTIYTIERI